MSSFNRTVRNAAFAVFTTASLVGCSTSLLNPTATSAVSNPTFRATLSSAAEVPPNASTGTGSLDARLDTATSKLSWTLVYSGLTGPAILAHFHGPAMPGSNAGVVVPFPIVTSPATGEATLTATQIADLMAGNWYVNVHTALHPGGEIRGQVLVN